MMVSPEVLIVDVGHGNCAVVIDETAVVVVDAPAGGTLADTLAAHGVKVVDAVLVSHSDEDHIAGLVTLLLDAEIEVGRVFLNPDAMKDTEAWRDLRTALAYARTRYGCVVITMLTSEINGLGLLPKTCATLEVMAPNPIVAVSGPGGADLADRRLVANTMSAVVRIGAMGGPTVLLSGDLDAVGLANIKESGVDVRADVLVFPHHGGLAGSRMTAFTKELCELVRPSVVVFSIGRNRHSNPRPEVVSAVRAAVPGCRIVCTQLSKHCATAPPVSAPSHLFDRPAKGRAERTCCGGTLVLSLAPPHGFSADFLAGHETFIATHAPSALCKHDLS